MRLVSALRRFLLACGNNTFFLFPVAMVPGEYPSRAVASCTRAVRVVLLLLLRKMCFFRLRSATLISDGVAFALVALGLLMNSPPITAQNGATSTSSTTREDKAEAILRRNLDVLGGLERWNNVKGIRIRGTVDDRDQSGSFVWEDHWQGRYKMSRQLHTEKRDQGFLQNPDQDQSLTPQSAEKPRFPKHRDFDPVSTLTTYAPGAAIALALHDPRYSFAVVHPAAREVRDLDCVKISRKAYAGGAPTSVVVCSNSDGLPQRAITEIANLTSPDQRLFEVIEYKSYGGFEGRQFPTRIALHSPLGRVRRYTFSGVEINPIMDKKQFREEAK